MSDKVRIMSHLFRSHDPLVILYLVLRTLLKSVEVWSSLTESGYCRTLLSFIQGHLLYADLHVP